MTTIEKKIKALKKHMQGTSPKRATCEEIIDGITCTLEQNKRMLSDLLREKAGRDRNPKEKAVDSLERIGERALYASDHATALGAQCEIDRILGLVCCQDAIVSREQAD